ncbi:MAG: tetratricopeptide repeat protein [Planctomycetota bacterium]
MKADSPRAQELFHRALDLAPGERAAFLDRACGSDAELRARVGALLDALAAAGEFFAEQLPTEGPGNEQPGATVGRYKLLEKIGEGGMGSIWMAEQRDSVKRRVALKIIKLGMDTRQVIARFEAERQALAIMDHPNIAKVFDAGATDTGRPYFVMEYIRGVPIVEYCDRERADTETRLTLFTRVCHAIQHAHQKGIIHRDIKPSNVLVTLYDGVPVPKVIDFGIAKATDSELTVRTLFTEHRQVIGTPAYMSPEQTEMSGLGVDTRSDVYSLGVLLYELLTGTTPFATSDLLSVGIDEMMRTLREVEPPTPSRRISTLGETSARTARQRRVDVKQLGTLFRGDLDWIVMRCLEKDRTRRYATASELAADIQRHLDDEPVTAGPPRATYRLRKFVRRNRGQVIAGGAVAAALLSGVVAFAWQAEVVRDQRDQAQRALAAEAEQRRLAEAATAEARFQTAIAEAVAEFQTEMIQAADPDNLLGDKVTVLQATEAAVDRLDGGSLADQPLLEAAVRQSIGQTFFGLGRYAAAESNFRKSLKLFQESLPAEHPRILRNLNQLAMVLNDEGERGEAELLLRQALDLARAAHPSGHRDIGTTSNNLALVLHSRHEFAEAEPYYRQALQIARDAVPVDQREIAVGLNNLASVLSALHRLDEAEPLQREALQIILDTLPPGHPDIATNLSNLAGLLQESGKLAEAEPLYRDALRIRREVLPAGHMAVGRTASNLGWLLCTLGRDDEGEPFLREGLEIARAALPAWHAQRIAIEDSYSTARLSAARSAADPRAWAAAESRILESMSVRTQAQPDHWSTYHSKSMLGEARQGQHRHAEAEALLIEGYRGMLERLASIPAGRAANIMQAALERIVRFYEATGNSEEAAAWRRRLEAESSEPPTSSAERGR